MRLSDLRWYLLYKYDQYIYKKRRLLRSQKSFMFLYMIYIGFGFLVGDREIMIAGLLLFLIWYIYVDFSRGVPRKWKYKKMVEKANLSSGSETQSSNAGIAEAKE